MLKMLRNQLVQRLTQLRCNITSAKKFTSTFDVNKLEQETAEQVSVYDEEIAKREEEIEKKRNKSRLADHDRRFLHEQNPYVEGPKYLYQGTVKYSRKLYGRYGQASGVDPAICWPTKQELIDKVEYESIAYPFTIPQMIEDAHKKRKEKAERIAKRQKEIVEKMGKLDGWIKDLQQRIAKKESEISAAKARRERLIEEVKAHFGYAVDPKDEKFQQMLEKKEKEQKKALKEARKKAQEAKVMERLLKKAPVVTEQKSDS